MKRGGVEWVSWRVGKTNLTILTSRKCKILRYFGNFCIAGTKVGTLVHGEVHVGGYPVCLNGLNGRAQHPTVHLEEQQVDLVYPGVGGI